MQVEMTPASIPDAAAAPAPVVMAPTHPTPLLPVAPPKVPEELQTYSEAWEHKADIDPIQSTHPIPTTITPQLMMHSSMDYDDAGEVSSLDTGYASSTGTGNAPLKRERSKRSPKSPKTPKAAKLKREKSRDKINSKEVVVPITPTAPVVDLPDLTPKRNLRDLIAKSASGLSLSATNGTDNGSGSGLNSGTGTPIQKPGRRSSLSAALDSSQAIRQQKANHITNKDNKMLTPVAPTPVAPLAKHKKIDVASAADRWKSLIKK